MQYTPFGAVAKVGTDAIKDTLDKLDIIEMSLEAELLDSQSGDVFGAIVIARGQRETEDQKEQRMDVDEFHATLVEYADHFRARRQPVDHGALPRTACFPCLAAAGEPHCDGLPLRSGGSGGAA